MESGDETRRLLVRSRRARPARRCCSTGPEGGRRVLDAGCGPGGIIGDDRRAGGAGGPGARGWIFSEERLAEARPATSARPTCASWPRGRAPHGAAGRRVRLHLVPVRHPVPARPAARALDELVRVTRPGRRVVMSEMDGFGLLNWPLPGAPCASGASVRRGGERTRASTSTWAARSSPSSAGWAWATSACTCCRSTSSPGAADEAMMLDWRDAFSTLEPVVAPALRRPGRLPGHVPRIPPRYWRIRTP